MKVRIDREDDALYFELDDVEIVESEEVQPGILLDFDKDGRVVGIEILDLSTRLTPEKLRLMQFETMWTQVVNRRVRVTGCLFIARSTNYENCHRFGARKNAKCLA